MNSSQHEKIKKYSQQIEDLRKIKEDYNLQINHVRILNEKLESHDSKERVYQTESKRLKNLEGNLAYSQERIKLKEDEILRLISDKAAIENDLKAVTTKFNRKFNLRFCPFISSSSS